MSGTRLGVLLWSQATDWPSFEAGARRVDEWELITRKIPSFDLLFKVEPDRMTDSEVTLSAAQSQILPLLDGTRDVRQVMEESGLVEFETGKALYGLITAGFAHRVGSSTTSSAPRATDARALGRIIIGNDAPSGTGVVPLGILRVIAHLASLGGVASEAAIAMATGNTARVYGLPVGLIEPGREADCCLVDAPVGSVGRTALEALRAGDTRSAHEILQEAVRLTQGGGHPEWARMLQDALEELARTGTISPDTRKTVAIAGRTRTTKPVDAEAEAGLGEEEIRRLTGG